MRLSTGPALLVLTIVLGVTAVGAPFQWTQHTPTMTGYYDEQTYVGSCVNVTTRPDYAGTMAVDPVTNSLILYGKHWRPILGWEAYYWNYSIPLDKWTLLAQSQFKARWFQPGGIIGNNFYQLQGVTIGSDATEDDPTADFPNTIIQFNLRTRQETQYGRDNGGDPGETQSTQTVVYNNTLTYFGGATSGDPMLRSFRYYKPSNKEFGQWPNNNAPGNRNGAAQTITQPNTLFVHGGSSGTFLLNDYWQYDFLSSTWTELTISNATLPTPRANHHAVYDAAQNAVFIFGGNGRDGSVLMVYNDLWVYFPNQMRWVELHPETIAPIPPTRAHYMFAYYQHSFWVYGGQSFDANGNTLTQYDLWEYNIDCPYRCSGHGTCNQLSCTCDANFAGFGCEIDLLAPLPGSNVTVYNNVTDAPVQVNQVNTTAIVGGVIGAVVAVIVLAVVVACIILARVRAFKKRKANAAYATATEMSDVNNVTPLDEAAVANRASKPLPAHARTASASSAPLMENNGGNDSGHVSHRPAPERPTDKPPAPAPASTATAPVGGDAAHRAPPDKPSR